MRRRRIKPLLTRPTASHRDALARQSERPKLPLQSTPIPRPRLLVRAPQRHPHVAVHDPDPIDTPSFSTPRPARKRRISETPLRPRRVSETPIPPVSHAPTARQDVDTIAPQPSRKRAHVLSSPILSGSRSVWSNVLNPSVSPMRNSALLASPGLLSAHVPLTIESVFSSSAGASQVPAALDTQRRISFGAIVEQPSQEKGAKLQSPSPSPTNHITSKDAENCGPPRMVSPCAQPHISPEPTQQRSSPPPQQQPPPETSQHQPTSDPLKVPSEAHSPLFPTSQRSPPTSNFAASQPSQHDSQPSSSSQLRQPSLAPKAANRSPLTTKNQAMKRFRGFALSPAAGNSICSWAGEMDSPDSAALNVFRKPKPQSNEAPLQLRGRSPAICTPSASLPNIVDSFPAREPKRTPARLKREPATTNDLEQLIPETPLQTTSTGDQEFAQAPGDALHVEDRIAHSKKATDELKRSTCRGAWGGVYANGMEDECSSTQSPCSVDGREDGTQNTKAQNAAVYCRSVLVSIPSGALRSFDHSESPP